MDSNYQIETLTETILNYGCPVIDNLLSNSLLTCGIIEIYGESGAGKSQLIILRSLLNKIISNIYPINRLKYLAYNRFPDVHDAIIRRICFDTPKNINQFLELCRDKTKLLTNHIRLIVVDCISEFFQEIRQLVHLFRILNDSDDNNKSIAIICVNQLRSLCGKIYCDQDTPALGKTWQSAVSTRIRITKTNITFDDQHILFICVVLILNYLLILLVVIHIFIYQMMVV